jgi:hypothetical protein
VQGFHVQFIWYEMLTLFNVIQGGERGRGRMMKRLSSTKVYFKHLSKMYTLVQLLYANKIIKNVLEC